MAAWVTVIVVVVTALVFDFTNGFHDTANAMATFIATGALRPEVAVLIAGALNHQCSIRGGAKPVDPTSSPRRRRRASVMKRWLSPAASAGTSSRDPSSETGVADQPIRPSWGARDHGVRR